jgi:hypothetical protein
MGALRDIHSDKIYRFLNGNIEDSNHHTSIKNQPNELQVQEFNLENKK